MNEISYGGYFFPHPYPFVSIGENQVFLSGQVDHAAMSISLIGEITGCDLTSIKTTKDEMVLALSSGFQQLNIGNTGYSFAKPTSINFSSSNLRKILPYEITFEGYCDRDFSNFFGISNPVDNWQFNESQNRIISATHTVSAKGLKVSTGDSLLHAKAFVDNRLNGFNNNISLFFSGETSILADKREEINRVENYYGITETYNLSTSSNKYDTENAIVRVSSRISYDHDSNLQVSVNGTIDGGISGSVSTGDFTSQQATEFAQQSVLSSKIPYEESLYGDVLKGPKNYNYDIDTGSNLISFSFSFADADDLRTGDVIHDYSVDVNASKDDGFVSVSVDGSVYYNTINDIFLTSAPEGEDRYKKVESYFSGISPFSIAQNGMSVFNSDLLPYSQSPLNDSIFQSNITKSPHQSEISYNYNFSNNPDLFSGIFKKVDFRIETDHSIPIYNVEQTTDLSFGVQNVYDRIERKTISLNGDLSDNVQIQDAINYSENFISQYSGSIGSLISHSLVTGSNRISINKQFAIL